MIKENEVLVTKFGNTSLDRGYYRITNGKNRGKLLHRLIWEDHYGKPVPEGYDIHHLNMVKTDNRIQNLQCVEHGLHMRFHHKGKIGYMKDKKHSKETKRKISEGESKAKNTSGYYRVHEMKDKTCKQGFIYVYRYLENGKQKSIYSVDIKKLEEKVKERGLSWFKIGDGNI